MTTANTTDREIVMTRVVDAPRELVFEVWTDPKHIAQWWGPNGFTNTIHEMDVRPGGVWRFIMHGPDGTDYPNKIVYEKVEKPSFLSYLHGRDGAEETDMFQASATFTERGDQTEVTLRLVFPTVEAREERVKFGAVEGGNQTLGRLEQYLKEIRHKA